MMQSLFEQAVFQPDIGVPHERNLFRITTRVFSNDEFDSTKPFMKNHCAYILENGKDAYIGETKDIERRTFEHLSRSEKNRLKKYHFKRLHIITGRLAEIGVAKQQETQLKILMELDGKFTIVNRNNGEPQHTLRKNLFDWYFDKLWPKLAKKELVDLKEFYLVINLNAYKYSPYTELSVRQNQELNNIINSIDYWENQPEEKSRPIVVCGDAGTGKTILATSLFYHLKTQERYKDKRIALVYANPATRSEIGDIFKNIKGLKKGDVVSPACITKEHFDIVICDEAHKLRHDCNLGFYAKPFRDCNKRLGLDDTCDELDWVLKNSNYQVLLYDEKQRTSPCDIPHTLFEQRLLTENSHDVRLITLDEQMRIKAGDKYVSYIYDVLYQRNPEPHRFDSYDFKIFSSMSYLKTSLDEKEGSNGLCRLGSGYAWPWKSKDGKSSFDFNIGGVDILWNTQTAGWLSNEDTKHEMGSIYTLPGLDLNFAGIVIGPDLYYDKENNQIKVNKRHFYDNKVKKGTTDEELKMFILNTYAVLLTRGISGTYIYVCDDSLREYLSKYIPLVNSN